MSYSTQQAPSWWAENRPGLLERARGGEEWTSRNGPTDPPQTTQETQSASVTSTSPTSSREMATGVLDAATTEEKTSISETIGGWKDSLDDVRGKVGTVSTLASGIPGVGALLGTATAVAKLGSMALGLGEVTARSIESGWMGDFANVRSYEEARDTMEDMGMSKDDVDKSVSELDEANSHATSDMSKTEAVDAALSGFFDGLDDMSSDVDSGNDSSNDSGSDNDSGGPGHGGRGGH